MPITLEQLKTALNPKKTALMLGAGASVPSGAPTGERLAELLWDRVAKSPSRSNDLRDTATYLVQQYSRRVVIDAIVSILSPLDPTGGMLALPNFEWRKIFTTNYDLLVEAAYRRARLPLVPIRSNYDFSTHEAAVGVRLYKLHGCITQDEALGHKASMVLTEDDYVLHEKYRQSLFQELRSSFMVGDDVLIIGQSLKDEHLNSLVRQVLALKQQEGVPGSVYVLAYEKEDVRAPVLENRGAKIAYGGLDEFTHVIAAGLTPPSSVAAPASAGVLPANLVSSVYDVAAQRAMPPNVTRMFNGGPATYADISAGATFTRAREVDVVEHLVAGDRLAIIITGAAGVGKTTFARRVLHELQTRGIHAWEHRTDFSFQHVPWTAVEANLRAAGQQGVLLLDECTHYLRQTNELVNHLSTIENCALRVLMTANAAQWTPRLKSPYIFSRGRQIILSHLEDAEINSLLNLLQSNTQIAALVHGDFKRDSRARQFAALRQKCSADMFVCLKNIFANESLDTILLTEYDELPEALQEHYRYVAALEAIGTRVHRQLLIRMLGLPADQVSAALRGLTGIVDEYDIKPANGIFGWATRHIVIARRITEYKFSSLQELTDLFETVIRNINPAEPIELQSVRDLCDADYGIGRLADGATRRRLYRQLIEIAPGERIPWHRLIRELLADENLVETEYLIRDAEQAVGADSPIDRYKVRLAIVRADKTLGISDADRRAILRRAYETATRNAEKYKWDKLAFTTLCDVAARLAQAGESEYYLDEAIQKLREAAERILDPDMQRRIQHYQMIRSRLR